MGVEGMVGMQRWLGTLWISLPIAALASIVLVVGVVLVAVAWRRKQKLAIWRRQISSLPAGPDMLEQITNVLKDDALLREQWGEFKEGIVERRVTRPDGMVKQEFFNSLPMDAFVKNEAYLSSIRVWLIEFSLAHQLPGIATGLGILGTFAGISVGLFELQGNLSAADILDFIPRVVSSLASSFSTSIFGVFVGLLVNLLANVTEDSVLSELERLREAIDRKIQRITSEHLLQEISDGLQVWMPPISETLAALGARVASADDFHRQHAEQSRTAALQLQTNLGHLRASFDRLGPEVHRELAHLRTLQTEHEAKRATQVEEGLSLLQEVRAEITESRAELQRISNDLADTFRSSLETIVVPPLQRLNDLVQEQSETRAASTEEQAKRFTDEMVGQISGSLQASFQHMSEQIWATSTHLSSVGESLLQSVARAQEATEQQHATLEASRRAVEAAVQHGHQASGQVAEAQSLTAQLATLVSEVREQSLRAQNLQEQQARLHSDSQAQVGLVADSIAGASQAYAATANQLTAVLPALEQLLTASGRGFSQAVATLGQQVTTVQGSVSALNQSAADAGMHLRALVKELADRVAAEKALVSQYGEASGVFSDAFRRSAPAIDTLRMLATELTDQRKHVQVLLESLRKTSDQVGVTGNQLREQLGEVNEILSVAANELRTATSGTQAWWEASNKAVAGFGAGVKATVESSLKEYDKSLAGAVGSLRAAMKELEDTAEEISSAASQRRAQ